MQRSPVLIIGAGRSGTNLLARILGEDPRFWNAFENRYIWNYKARTLAHDVRTAEEATPRVRAYIRRFFARMADQNDRVVVDKTPSNVLRVAFAHAVLPEARFINLVRDARDNVVSRRVEWYGGKTAYRAPAEGGTPGVGRSDRPALLRRRIEHMGAMVRRGNLPPERWPTFLRDNFGPFVRNLISGQPVRWGDRFPGIGDALRAYGLLITAGIQWREGVLHATTDGRRLPANQYLELRYEDLLTDPELHWGRIAAFLGIEVEGPCLDYIRRALRRENVGKWRTQLSGDDLRALEPHIRPSLEFLGYEWT
mgnify:CR=1 FL=1